MLNRFLGALKSQLERKWKEAGHAAMEEHAKPALTTRATLGHIRALSLSLRPQVMRLKDEDKEQESEPLSPALPHTHTGVEKEDHEQPVRRNTKRFFVANARWSIKRDGTRAVLEFIRALIGYVLYVCIR